MNPRYAFREVMFAPMSVGANQSSDIFFNPWLKPLRKPDSAVSVRLPASWYSTKSGLNSPLATSLPGGHLRRLRFSSLEAEAACAA
jgi:hypothetical protein